MIQDVLVATQTKESPGSSGDFEVCVDCYFSMHLCVYTWVRKLISIYHLHSIVQLVYF